MEPYLVFELSLMVLAFEKMPKWERKPLEIGRTKFKPTFKNLQFFSNIKIGIKVLLKRKNYTTLVKTKFLRIGITILNFYQKIRNI
jgi:hypothetical protein